MFGLSLLSPDIKHELIVQRRMLEDAVSAVKKMSKDVTQRIFLTQRNVDNYSELFEKVDFWRWTAGIGKTIVVQETVVPIELDHSNVYEFLEA